jgi:ATP phosphoribosyltransferase
MATQDRFLELEKEHELEHLRMSKNSEKKEFILGIISSISSIDTLEENQLMIIDELLEREASSLQNKIDESLTKIDAIWREAPEIVTGGGYELHIAREDSDA